MNKHFESLEAAFQREYGLNLATTMYGRDRVSTRRLVSLLRGLGIKTEPRELPDDDVVRTRPRRAPVAPMSSREEVLAFMGRR